MLVQTHCPANWPEVAQVCPVPHALHVPPLAPQACAVVPAWHCPVPSQQPLAHFATQVPFWQHIPAAWQLWATPLTQVRQFAPSVSLLKHCPLTQHWPVGQPQTPLVQQPPAQALLGPQVVPLQQVPAGQQVVPHIVPLQAWVFGSQQEPAGQLVHMPLTQQPVAPSVLQVGVSQTPFVASRQHAPPTQQVGPQGVPATFWQVPLVSLGFALTHCAQTPNALVQSLSCSQALTGRQVPNLQPLPPVQHCPPPHGTPVHAPAPRSQQVPVGQFRQTPPTQHCVDVQQLLPQITPLHKPLAGSLQVPGGQPSHAPSTHFWLGPQQLLPQIWPPQPPPGRQHAPCGQVMQPGLPLTVPQHCPRSQSGVATPEPSAQKLQASLAQPSEQQGAPGGQQGVLPAAQALTPLGQTQCVPTQNVPAGQGGLQSPLTTRLVGVLALVIAAPGSVVR